MKSTAFILLFVLVGLTVAHGQSNDTTKLIDEIFSHWNNATPGGSVAISRGDKVFYKKAFGLADLEHNTPNTTETIFECGSVSKQFTAASILLLENEGKLSLKDDVRKFIPELPTYQATITIQHLLNHTSGLRDWGSMGALAGWPRTTRVYTQDLALQIICRQKSLNFVPGARYSYSNSNYTLLVTIVERLSHETLAQFTKTRFFEPLGMTHTQWRNNFREVIPNRAVAYSKSGEVFQQEMPFENIYGHGGLLTTTSDLLTWNKMLVTNSIGGNNFTARRTQKGILNNGSEVNYAAGLFIDKFNGYAEINHSGATAGYRGWLAYYPQKKLSVAMMSNDGSFSPATVGRQVAQIFLGKDNKDVPPPHKPVALSAGDAKRFEGMYKSNRGWVITLSATQMSIYLGSTLLVPLHKDTLFNNGTRYILTKPNQLLLQYGTDTSYYVRKNEPQLNPTFIRELAGDYYSEDADVTFSVLVDEATHNVTIRRNAETPFSLRPVYLDGFMTTDNDVFEFSRNKQGKVNELIVAVSRAERVIFKKVSQKK